MKQTMKLPIKTEKTIKQLFPDSEAVFAKAAAVMLLKADRCICDVPVNTYYTRIPHTYQYKCGRCRLVVSPLAITPLSRAHKNLTDTLELVCRLHFIKKELSPVEIAALYKCKYETAKRKSNRAIQWMKLALIHSGKTFPNENIKDTKVIRAFSAQHNSLNAAVDSLFNALPSLKDAMKNNSKNQ